MVLPEGLELRIYVEQGAVKVSGQALNDKMLCYALLGAARDRIKDYADELAKNGGIVPAGAHALASLGKNPVRE